MPERFTLDPELIRSAIFDRRWETLSRLDLDLSTAATWDRQLPRDRRILVPVDVQAFVVTGSGETTVAVTGGPDDPPPFAQGNAPEVGVHLHWAMPDALLRARDARPGVELELPVLPDRWVVVRAVFPDGIERPLLRSWVIDATTGTITDLVGFDGEFPPGSSAPTLDPLDGTSGGSPMWTASYHASRGRFGLHDSLADLADLGDLAPRGLHSDHAVYTVAGWWSDPADDPLGGRDAEDLLAALAELDWNVDQEVLDSAHEPEDPAEARMESVGPFQRPASSPLTELVVKGRRERFEYSDVTGPAGIPIVNAERIVVAARGPVFASLLHGAVTGVPVGRDLPAVDDRPAGSRVEVAVGQDLDDIVSALGAATLGVAERRSAERLAAAFTSDLLDRLGSPDGVDDIAEHEHSDTFWSFAGAPLPAARPDRLRAEDSAPLGPTAIGRKGRAGQARRAEPVQPMFKWQRDVEFAEARSAARKPGARIIETELLAALGESREVTRPAPRLFRPQPMVVALRGIRPSLRHHHDGDYDDQGLLRCRFREELAPEVSPDVSGSALIPTLGSGAIPPEVTGVVRESVLLDPYATQWLAEASSVAPARRPLLRTRLQAEMLRLYSPDGRYDGTGRYTLRAATGSRSPIAGTSAAAAGTGASWAAEAGAAQVIDMQVAAELSKASLLAGSPPSPVGITAWRQPWVPLWLEWEATVQGSDTLAGWELGSIDLQLASEQDPPPLRFSLTGRNPLGGGAGRALHAGIERWLESERQRDSVGRSTLDAGGEADLAALADLLAPLDLASASLDGIREQLLGIPYVGGLSSGDDDDDRPEASGAAVPLFGGTIRLDRLRVIDAFGRSLDIPVSKPLTTTELEVKADRAAIRVRPRLQHGARWLLRLVDPAHTGDAATAPEAYVDQIDPTRAVSPVTGFLLPDHVDEALEVFDAAGGPIGQLRHDEISGAVRWEPAPGRPVAPGAGPLTGLSGASRLVGEFAGGVVRADVRARSGDSAPTESSLTAMLRAIDTTLASVDTFAALGTPSVAGLVGRPIAVVRATLRLEIPDDLAEVRITHAGGESERRATFERVRELRYPVRLGALRRSDDSLLGFFVDDDYDHLHLVDKVVAAMARDAGRHRGHLGLLGSVLVPGKEPLAHPYLHDEDTLLVRPGQVVTLTLLMLPAGRVHLTSGILPRKSLALADAWVEPGLRRLVPSVRVGPLLVDPGEIRMPKVSTLGERQRFTRRTGPLTWRDDPIVAATQSALLPRLPHEVQEGWIRVEDGGQ